MRVVNIARDHDCVAHAHGYTLALVDSPEPPEQIATLLTRNAQFTVSRVACQASVSDFNVVHKSKAYSHPPVQRLIPTTNELALVMFLSV